MQIDYSGNLQSSLSQVVRLMQLPCGEWILYRESETGVRARVYDVVIPSDLSEHELAAYLDDIYHEWATSKNWTVERLN